MGKLRGLPALSVADLMRLYRVSAKKSLSQNFILDEAVTDKFVAAAGDLVGRHVIEVGPGPGLLTRSIIKAGAAKVTVVEKDHRFIPFLEQLADASDGVVDVLHQDVLTLDYGSVITPPLPGQAGSADQPDPAPVHVIGNLPFGVATPLLFQYLRMSCDGSGPFAHGPAELTLCFQKEVADRMVAPQGDRVRSRISMMVQHCCEATVAYALPRTVFVPSPKVDAAVVRLTPSDSTYSKTHSISYDEKDTVVRAIFGSRRKTLRNNLLSSLDYTDAQLAEALAGAGIDGGLRAQALGNDGLHALCEHLVRVGGAPKLVPHTAPQKRVRRQPRVPE